jgi:hypothetical protein
MLMTTGGGIAAINLIPGAQVAAPITLPVGAIVGLVGGGLAIYGDIICP